MDHKEIEREARSWYIAHHDIGDLAKDAKELASPAQERQSEPVAWMGPNRQLCGLWNKACDPKMFADFTVPLYTHPVEQERKEVTPQIIEALERSSAMLETITLVIRDNLKILPDGHTARMIREAKQLVDAALALLRTKEG